MPAPRSYVPVGALALAAVLGWGCATSSASLRRAQHEFEEGEDERALAIFRSLEPHLDGLTSLDQARYAYLRGMTDYRMGYKPEARHWLGLATALEAQTPGSLAVDCPQRMTEALDELNEAVYAAGDDATAEGMPSSAGASALPEGNPDAAAE